VPSSTTPNILFFIIIFYWLSYAIYLIPLPDSTSSSQGSTVGTGKSEDIQELVDEESKFTRLIAVFYIFGGIVSCVLILKRQNMGRYIAIGFSLIVLSKEAWHYGTGLSLKLLFYELKIAPGVVIRNEILRTVICILTIIHLTRPSVISEFNHRGSPFDSCYHNLKVKRRPVY
jgi:hypothetical protein